MTKYCSAVRFIVRVEIGEFVWAEALITAAQKATNKIAIVFIFSPFRLRPQPFGTKHVPRFRLHKGTGQFPAVAGGCGGAKKGSTHRLRRRVVGVFDASTSPSKEWYAMTNTNIIKLGQPGTFTDSLTEILRNGARALLTQAVETEVADFLGR
jgi:hypothetical protein